MVGLAFAKGHCRLAAALSIGTSKSNIALIVKLKIIQLWFMVIIEPNSLSRVVSK